MDHLPPGRHPHFTGWTNVEGYCWPLSYRPGEPVEVRCSARVATFAVEVSRIGAERTVVWRRSGLRADDHGSASLGLGDRAWSTGCDWPPSFVIQTEPSWPSGFYHITFQGESGEGATLGDGDRSDAFFVIRPGAVTPSGDPDRVPNPLLVLSTNTYNAYNQWGGRCLYSGATEVSFARPLERGYLNRRPLPSGFDGRVANIAEPSDPDHQALQAYQSAGNWPLWTGSSGWHNWERRFVAWAEGAGVDIDIAVNADLQFNPELLDGRRLLLSVGHDEYWSWEMRDAVDDFVEHGGNWAIFSGNTCFWQVRLEDEGRTMVCYKDRARVDDPVVATEDRHRLTSIWSDPIIGRPETSTTGLTFTRGGYYRMGQAQAEGPGTYTVHRPDHWAFAGTNVGVGHEIGAGHYIVAYEVDGCELEWTDGYPRPTGVDGAPHDLDVLATAPARLVSITDERSEAPEALWASTDPPGDLEATAHVLFGEVNESTIDPLAAGHAVMGCFARGDGMVFNAGTTDWAYGLGLDRDVDQITMNVLDQLNR